MKAKLWCGRRDSPLLEGEVFSTQEHECITKDCETFLPLFLNWLEMFLLRLKASCALGTPRAARNAPMYAKGRAKIVCSTFTSDAKSRG